MCMSCGCMQPNDDHGDQRNITYDQIQRAGQAANISSQQAAQNIQNTEQAVTSGRVNPGGPRQSPQQQGGVQA